MLIASFALPKDHKIILRNQVLFPFTSAAHQQGLETTQYILGHRSNVDVSVRSDSRHSLISLAAVRRVDCKVVMLGRANTGKTCLSQRFLADRFLSTEAPTVGAAFGQKTVTLPDGKSCNIGLWDTSGAERFESLTKHYLQSAVGAVICFDVTDLESWEKVKHWVKEISTVEENCFLAIVACKCDLISQPELGTSIATSPSSSPRLQRCISADDARKYAQSIDGAYFETSARTGEGAQAPFLWLAQQWSDRRRGAPAANAAPNTASAPVSLSTSSASSTSSSSTGCCK